MLMFEWLLRSKSLNKTLATLLLEVMKCEPYQHVIYIGKDEDLDGVKEEDLLEKLVDEG